MSIKCACMFFIVALIAPVFLVCVATNSDAQSSLSAATYEWTRLQWSGDDRPYIESEQTIGRELERSGHASDNVIAQYRDEATKSPRNQLALYRWAYAAYASNTHATPILIAHERTEPLLSAMLSARPPFTYRYMRLLYLVGPPNSSLRWLGEKLIKAAPSDTHVIYQQIYVLIDGRYTQATQDEALKYDSELLKKYPNNAAYWGTRGTIYSASSTALKANPKAATLAIECFRKELSLMAPNDQWRPFVDGQIRGIEHWQKYGHW